MKNAVFVGVMRDRASVALEPATEGSQVLHRRVVFGEPGPLPLPEWRKETSSLALEESKAGDVQGESRQMAPPLSKKRCIRDAEEFVCLPYLGFVQNILGRMRSMVMSILWLFVAIMVAISSYPFDPREGLSATMLAVFLALGAVICYVYWQMHRDATLSRITNTTPRELGVEFWLKLAGFDAAPLLGLLATHFPGIADLVTSLATTGAPSRQVSARV